MRESPRFSDANRKNYEWSITDQPWAYGWSTSKWFEVTQRAIDQVCEGLKDYLTESLILAQNERWRRG